MNSTDRISLVQSANGEWNVLYNGRLLYSRFAPSDSAEKLSRQAPVIENCIYIIPSPLLGYGILSFMDRIPESSIVIGLETDQEIMALCSEFQTSLLDREDRYRSFRLESTGQLYEVFKSIQREHFRKCILVPLNAGYREKKENYNSLFTTFQHFLKNYWQNRLTLAKMAPLWIRNLTENLPVLCRPDISDFRTDKPVLLAGAGESLEGTIPLIRQYRSWIYLLCVDTAVQVLIRNGIIPDGIVNLEAQFYNLQDFYSIGEAAIDLFSDITAYPQTLRPDNFRHYIFMSSFAETSLHERLSTAELLPTAIPPLGSVGVTALYLAGMITDREIFLTGLDFSYTDGKTHAVESPFHDYCRLRENRFTGDVWYSFSLSKPSYTAAGKSGVTKTNTILESYGRQLDDLCRTMNNRVFDLARRGLKLGIPALDQGGFIERISGRPENEAGLSNPESTPAELEDSLSRFIGREKKRLEDLVYLWDSITSGEAEEDAILPVLKECSYLYFHFPDRKMLPNTDPAFLFRVIREARILLRRFR